MATWTCEVAFASQPLATTPIWTDVSSRLISVSAVTGRQSELDDWQATSAEVVLDNSDRALDPLNTGSAYYPNVKPRRRIRLQAVSGSTFHVFTGFTDGYIQSYRPPRQATVRISVSDLTALISNHRLPRNVYEIEVMADTPLAYWPMDETDGATMLDASGNAHDGTYQRTDGLTEGLQTAETVTLANGLEYRVQHFDGVTWGELPTREGLPIAGPFTLEYVVQLDPRAPYPTPYTRYYIAQWGDGTAAGTWRAYVIWDVTNNQFQHALTIGATAYIQTNWVPQITSPLLYTWTVPSGGGAPTLYQLGVPTPVTTSAAIGQAYSGVRIGRASTLSGPGSAHQGWDGPIGPVSIYGSALSGARLIVHTQAFRFGYPWSIGETTGPRANHVLDQIGVPSGLRAIDTGLSKAGAANLRSAASLDMLDQLAKTEQGALYIDQQHPVFPGGIRFRNRTDALTDTRSTTVQATFSDADIGGVIRFERDDLTIDPGSEQLVYNQALVKWPGGQVLVKKPASEYGPRRRDIDTLAASASDARGIGEWFLDHYSDLVPRVSSLTIDLAAQPAVQATVLGLRIWDRVAFRLLPQGIGAAITLDMLIEGIDHQAADGRNEHTVTLHLSPADIRPYWIWGTSTWGETTRWAF